MAKVLRWIAPVAIAFIIVIGFSPINSFAEAEKSAPTAKTYEAFVDIDLRYMNRTVRLDAVDTNAQRVAGAVSVVSRYSGPKQGFPEELLIADNVVTDGKATLVMFGADHKDLLVDSQKKPVTLECSLGNGHKFMICTVAAELVTNWPTDFVPYDPPLAPVAPVVVPTKPVVVPTVPVVKPTTKPVAPAPAAPVAPAKPAKPAAPAPAAPVNLEPVAAPAVDQDVPAAPAAAAPAPAPAISASESPANTQTATPVSRFAPELNASATVASRPATVVMSANPLDRVGTSATVLGIAVLSVMGSAGAISLLRSII